METFNPRQLVAIAAANKTIVWLFRVRDIADNIYYWSTGTQASSGNEVINVGAIEAPGVYTDNEWERAHTFKIVNFSTVSLRRNKSESGIHAPNDVSFSIVNSSNVLTASNFVGGTVRIGLAVNDGSGQELVGSWRFRIKSASPYNQQIDIVAEDFMQEFLAGTYPNTRLISDIFPNAADTVNTTSGGDDNLCIPEPYGTCYIPLRSVYAVDARYYILGDTVNTYTINEVRSPRELGTKIVWTSAGFTFTQYTKADADAVNWRVFQPLIADGNSGLWLSGSTILDMPTKFSRSDTAAVTNPADIIRRVLRNMGLQDYDLNLASFDTAKATFTSWGLAWNFAFYYTQDRTEVLAQLLAMCHSALIVGEQISLQVLVKASQKTITSVEVLKMQEIGLDTFKYTDTLAERNSDSGYVAFQQTGESQDEFIKILVPAKTTTATIDSETIVFPGVQDSQQVQKLGTLYYQRKFLKSADISATLKGTCLALRPDDVITINYADYGGTYDVLIDEITINADVSVNIRCLKFSAALDDWGDLAPGAITIVSDTASNTYSPVIVGPDSTPTSGTIPNLLPGRLRIGAGSDYILLDPDTPLRISLYDNDVEIYRAGNLNGFLGYVAEIYGLAIGEATKYLKYDPTNGLRIAGAISGSTIDIGGADATSFHVDIDGNLWAGAATFNIATNPFAVSNAGVLRAASGTIGGWTIGANAIYTGTEDHSGYTANAGDITIYSDGSDSSIHAKNFYIDTAGNLFATGVDISGLIKGSYIYGSSIFTKGTYISVSCSAADATLNVGDTTDFAASGTAIIFDTTNDLDTFTYTGKTSTTLTGCSGVLAHTVSATNRPLVAPSVAGLYLSDLRNEMRVVGDRGDGTYEVLAIIGVTDTVERPIAKFGSTNYTYGGVVGRSKSAYGVEGKSIDSYGGYFTGDNLAPILLVPSSSASAPSHTADKGALWVTSAGILYINTDGGTTWGKVGAQ